MAAPRAQAKARLKRARTFERAVYAFVQRLDPAAEIFFDHVLLDRQTLTERQADVWINAKLGGHIPFSILVSCKHHGRPLHIGHIETFAAEVGSLGASMGIIYSSSGFSTPALQKAEALGIACCRLYRSQPADLPGVLLFHSYLCQARLGLPIVEGEARALGVSTWTELLDLAFVFDGKRQTVAEALGQMFTDAEEWSLQHRPPTQTFPEGFSRSIRLKNVTASAVTLTISGQWRKFKGRMEAHLADGSYSFQNTSFLGTISGPLIDMRSGDPGAGWEEILDNPFCSERATMLAVRYGTDAVPCLRKALDGKALP